MKGMIGIIKPDQQDFCMLAKDHDIIPVYRTIPADMETPVSVYLKITGAEPGSYLLESGDLGEKARYSFIGCDPFISVYTEGEETVVEDERGQRRDVASEPLSVLEKVFNDLDVHIPGELSAFWGGAVGYISYDIVRCWENIPPGPQENRWPLCCFNFSRKTLIYDHRRHLLTIIFLVCTGDDEKNNILNKYEAAENEIGVIIKKLKNNRVNTGMNSAVVNSGDSNKSANGGSKLLSNGFEREEYETAVKKIKEHILEGDIFQVVLSRRVTTELKVHPFNLYRALRSLNPSPYQFYLSFEGFQVLGASPEMLVSLKKGYASTRPIAGTRPRGTDEKTDISLAGELSRDEKERAEHMMLVDLGRNDLGRVCEYGSVKVVKLLEIEYFSHVIHLVSEVTGRIRPGCSFADLLRAAFPAGTVSGAPKVRSMEIISALEPVGRGPYAGAVGYIGFNGDMDTCISIRTVIAGEGLAHIQAGAGIVADSEPYREFEETEHKMAASLRAINTAEEWEKNDFNY